MRPATALIQCGARSINRLRALPPLRVGNRTAFVRPTIGDLPPERGFDHSIGAVRRHSDRPDGANPDTL
jgi:hypothetical protein